jgi:hypothetical protein
VPFLIIVAALGFAALYLRVNHRRSAAAIGSGLGLLAWILWIAYLWTFTGILFKAKGLAFASLKDSLIKILGISLIASIYDSIVVVLSKAVVSVIGKVLLYFVGTYLVYIWFAIALACIAKGFKYKRCVCQTIS